MKNKPFVLVASIAALLGLLALSPRASAQQFWDGSQMTPDHTIHGGSGSWDTTNTNWTNIQGTVNSVYSNSTDVIFSGASGIVTIGSTITTNNATTNVPVRITTNGNSVRFSTDGYVINTNGTPSVLETFSGFAVDPGLTATINAPITDSSAQPGPGPGLTKNGEGTLILTGVNTYTGITAINAGVLSISQDANLGTAPGTPVGNQLAFDGGTLQATASFTLNPNRGVQINAGDATFDVTGANVLTYGGMITGTGTLTKTDTGTLILAGVNSYAGITMLNGGVLSISQDLNLGTPPSTAVPSQLTFDGGTLQATASFTLNPNRGVKLNAGGGTLDVTNANVLTYGGMITGLGNLSKIGTGTLTLSGNNTYGGATLVSAGVLQAGSGSAFSANSAFTVNSQLDLNGFSNTIGSLAGSGIVTNNGAASAALAVGNDNTNTTFSGSLRDGTNPGGITGNVSPLGITKIGTGTLTLSGVNTYTGITTINAGVLSISQDANLGAMPTGTLVPNQLTFNGGTLQATASFALNANRGVTLNAGGTLDVTGANVLTYDGVITGPGNLTKVGTGALALKGANTYTGATTISAGTLQLGAGGTTGSIAGDVTNNGILAFDRSDVLTFGGLISGTGSVQQNGTGTTVLVQDNTYSGGTTINAGTLQLGNDGTTGSIAGDVTNNGILAFDRSNVLTFDGVISGTGSVQQNGTGTTVLVRDNTYSGGTTINAGTLQLGNGGMTGSIAGDVTNNGILAFDRSDVLTFGGLISGTGSVQQNGTGTTVLVQDNTYSGGTTINAGTLQLGNDGTTGSIAGDVTNNGILAFDRSNVLTFDGVISGTGSVQQNGTGTTVLVRDNTYSGGTTINAGTLQLGNGGMTGSIAGDVTNNGILAFDRSDVLTFGGLISGTGSVQQNGTGTTVLVQDNTYSGGTTINAGTLQLGNDGTTGSIAGDVTNNGILAFDRSNVLTFDGVISGTGSVQQNGTGTTVLVRDNTYSGGTTINAGTLQLGNGGMTGSIAGDVTNNGILAFDRSDVLTFGGLISGTGSVQQNGNGTTVLVRDNTYTGVTTVNAGSLIVDGSIASVQTVVNAGALLGGHGSIGGGLVNSGIVSPGDSPGTLTVNGDYTQNAAGTLRIEIGGLALNQHDLLAVNGHVTLGGTLQLLGVNGFKLQVGDKITFLTANGGISGTFGTVQDELATGTAVKAQIISLPDAVLIEATQGSFVQAACTPNTVAVAQALDSIAGDPRASTLITFLNERPFNELCGDFALISPEALASIFNIGVSLANVQTANLKRRMEDIRAGSNGFSSAGFSLNGSAPNVIGGLAGVTGPEGKSGPSVMTPTPENRWGVWVTGIGEFTNVDSTGNAAGYDLQTGGVTLGVDYRISSNFAVGLTAGYAHTGADIANGGDLQVNGGKLGLYATAFTGGFYADAAVTGGFSGYDSHRTALLGTANGSTTGGDVNVLIAAGYDWKMGGLSVGPTANFQYTYVGFSGFTESGSLAPLKFNDQNADSERTAVGMKASYDWKVGHVIIKPELNLAWQHEFGDQAYSIVSSFPNGGGSFTVNSPQVGRDSMLIGAGAAVLLNERISIYAYYDGELLRTNYQSNNVSAGVRVTF